MMAGQPFDHGMYLNGPVDHLPLLQTQPQAQTASQQWRRPAVEVAAHPSQFQAQVSSRSQPSIIATVPPPPPTLTLTPSAWAGACPQSQSPSQYQSQSQFQHEAGLSLPWQPSSLSTLSTPPSSAGSSYQHRHCDNYLSVTNHYFLPALPLNTTGQDNYPISIQYDDNVFETSPVAGLATPVPSFFLDLGSSTDTSAYSHNLLPPGSEPQDQHCVQPFDFLENYSHSLQPTHPVASPVQIGDGAFRMSNPPWNFTGVPLPPQQAEPTSDDYLQALLTNDFSSPSLPPLSPRLQRGRQQHGASTAPHQQPGPRITGGLEQTSPRNAGAAHNPIQIDLDQTSDDQTPSSPSASMATRKRSRASMEDELSGPAKARRTLDPGPRTRPTISPKRLPGSSGKTVVKDVFDDDLTSDDNEIDVVDLADTEDIPVEEPPKPEEDNSIKLGAFQCVICMDDVTALSVTYCGHLFCSECLHSSLNIDPSKKICPICRQKIDLKTNGRARTNKTYWPLELKLMTVDRKGKRAAK